METRELQIRAKKISQLNDYNLNVDQNKDNSYILIGYNKGTRKENFKISLGNFLELIEQHSTILNDDELVDKINMFIREHRIPLGGPQGPQGPQGPNSAEVALDEIRNQISGLDEIINNIISSLESGQYATQVTSDSDLFIDVELIGTENNDPETREQTPFIPPYTYKISSKNIASLSDLQNLSDAVDIKINNVEESTKNYTDEKLSNAKLNASLIDTENLKIDLIHL